MTGKRETPERERSRPCVSLSMPDIRFPHRRRGSGPSTPWLGSQLASFLFLCATAAGDVTSLPFAPVRVGRDLGPVWDEGVSGTVGSPQLQIPWGEAVANLSDGVAVTGFKWPGPLPDQRAVWIWAQPEANDPLFRYGMRHIQTLRPIVDPTNGTTDGYGSSIASGERWLFVGAPRSDVAEFGFAGAVHVYTRAAPGQAWTPLLVLASPLPATNERFGTSLDFDGTHLIVGVPGRGLTGGAVIYPVSWPESSQGTPSVGTPVVFEPNLGGGLSVHLGTSVAISGEHCAIADGAENVVGGTGIVVVGRHGNPPSVEAILTSPVAQTSTSFGVSIALDGDRLAIGAPREKVNDLPYAGVVRIYEPSPSGWAESLSVAGDVAHAHLGTVDMADGFLAIGSELAPVGTFVGRSSLYRIDRRQLTHLASAKPVATWEEFREGMGKRVALGFGRWTYTESVAFLASEKPSVRTFVLSDPGGDCDRDGTTDLDEVANGAVDADCNGVPDTCPGNGDDCDGDGVSDSASTVLAPGMTFDLTGWWGPSTSTTNFAVAIMWLLPATVPLGTDGVLRGVETDWIQAWDSRAQPCFVAVYDDPNQDGDPSDAVYRGAYRAAVEANPGRDRVFLPEPMSIGSGGTRYFIGLGAIGIPPAPKPHVLRSVKWTPGATAVSYVTYANNFAADQFDVEHPQQNDVFHLFSSVPTMVGVGLFNSTIDANGNAVPDQCECVADLNGDGSVDGSDLSELISAWGGRGSGIAADLNRDGEVGPADLASLLSAWGGCGS